MKPLLPVLSAAVFAVSVTTAMASSEPSCDSARTGKWLSKQAVGDLAKGLGYDVRRIKTEDGCYEVYAIDGKGRRVEAFFNPQSGKLVGKKVAN